ncbi:L,D-transpeptidase family protein [Zooshikella sp. RANM57]|uniref:L,D-transpeptidase family protein n=1 Tax=Zooshikella sp. RANM57 TaxID=3425863 RepID=UPI003D6F89EC
MTLVTLNQKCKMGSFLALVLLAFQGKAFSSTMAVASQQYYQLSMAFLRYHQLAQSSVWQSLPTYDQFMLYKPEDKNALLAQLLTATGDHKTSSDPLYLAIQRYQRRHQLPASGHINKATYLSLYAGPGQKAQLIAQNLKRLEHLPDDLGRRYVMVNVPDYSLQYVENGEIKLSMRVIVGKPYRPTPLMVDTIRSIIVNPTWTVPSKIAYKDILPKLQKQPNYLKKHNFSLFQYKDNNVVNVDFDDIDWDNINFNKVDRSAFPYQLRQSSGSHNALGRFKFNFPNSQAIYLHDTPQKYLFSRHNRALSSGCVRVEKPRQLAEQLLKNNRYYSSKKIDQVLNSGQMTTLSLHAPVPVYITYLTAWINKEGELRFARDVYNKDKLRRISMAGK